MSDSDNDHNMSEEDE